MLLLHLLKVGAWGLEFFCIRYQMEEVETSENAGNQRIRYGEVPHAKLLGKSGY